MEHHRRNVLEQSPKRSKGVECGVQVTCRAELLDLCGVGLESGVWSRDCDYMIRWGHNSIPLLWSNPWDSVAQVWVVMRTRNGSGAGVLWHFNWSLKDFGGQNPLHMIYPIFSSLTPYHHLAHNTGIFLYSSSLSYTMSTIPTMPGTGPSHPHDEWGRFEKRLELCQLDAVFTSGPSEGMQGSAALWIHSSVSYIPM